MDPQLLDLIWEVSYEVGAKEPIQVVCGYRSPETNAMLRHRSRGVAQYSQHTVGRAMDFFIPGVSLESQREAGLRLGERTGEGVVAGPSDPLDERACVGALANHDELARTNERPAATHGRSTKRSFRNAAGSVSRTDVMAETSPQKTG